MKPVKTKSDVEAAARKTIESLYFLLDGTQYTVDLVVMEKDGQIINARLIDKMIPL